MMVSNSIEIDKDRIFQGQEHEGIGADFNPEVQSRILKATGFALCLTTDTALFWQKTEHACRNFAASSRSEKLRPTATEYQAAYDAAARLKLALKPLLEEEASELIVTLYTHSHQLGAEIKTFRLNEPDRSRSVRNAPSNFIWEIGGLYMDGFARSPSETLDGPFARFVIACLTETKGIKDIPSYEWVQKWTRRRRKSGFWVGRLIQR